MLIFIHASFGLFVKNDYEIVKKFCKVKKYHYKQGKTLAIHLISQLKLFTWLLINIWKANKIVCWFADYHSFLPTLFAIIFKKKIYLILGGYDVVHIPEVDYGSLKNPVRRYCAVFSIKHATLNLPVSHAVHNEALKLVPAADYTLVYNGIDTTPFKNLTYNKQNLILTVGIGDTLQRIKLKGIDFFSQIAQKLPQYEFIIVGITPRAQMYLKHIPRNLKIFDKLKYSELLEFYKKAKIYCQFSLIESFGMALAEAMLCECIPVVFNTGALPEIIGDTGYIIEDRSITVAIEKINEALSTTLPKGEQARKRIIRNFPLQKREEKLVSLLNLKV